MPLGGEGHDTAACRLTCEYLPSRPFTDHCCFSVPCATQVQDDLEWPTGRQANLSNHQPLRRVVAEMTSLHPMSVGPRRPRLDDEVNRHLPDASGLARQPGVRPRIQALRLTTAPRRRGPAPRERVLCRRRVPCYGLSLRPPHGSTRCDVRAGGVSGRPTMSSVTSLRAPGSGPEHMAVGTAETDRQLTNSTRLMYSADMAAFTAGCASVGRRPLPAPQLRLRHPGRGESGALRAHRRLRQQPTHPRTARLPQPHRIRGAVLRRPGDGRTSEPEHPSTRLGQLISTSRTTGEPQRSETTGLGKAS
jgi:hypothetical protein